MQDTDVRLLFAVGEKLGKTVGQIEDLNELEFWCWVEYFGLLKNG